MSFFEAKAIFVGPAGVGPINPISGVNRIGISVEETVGDEMWLKSGDIVVTGKLSFSQPFGLWNRYFGLYVNGQLWNIYNWNDDYEYIFDEKRNRYEYRLPPLQKKFYEDLRNVLVRYSSDSDSWNFGVSGGAINIKEIRIKSGTGSIISALNRYGFALTKIIKGLAGKSNGFDYKINQVNWDAPVPYENDLPILFRGSSKDIGTPVDEAVNWTFYEEGSNIFHMTWFDLFKLAIFGWNAFIRVTPVLIGNPVTDIGLNIDILPKINLSQSGVITPTWVERKFIPEKFKLDGVKLTGENFSYSQGNVNGANVLERAVEIYDYDEPTTAYSTALYWAEGDYDTGVSKYDLVNPYFGSGLVEPYYADMITAGNGIEGELEILYNGGANVLKVLDQVQAGSRVIQLNRISMKDSRIARVEGIVI